MAGGPRKFSEKIALLNKMEQEGNAAFASIIGEVRTIQRTGTNEALADGTVIDPNHAGIDEAIANNEKISILYENQQQQQQQQQQPHHSNKHQNHSHHNHPHKKHHEDHHSHSQSLKIKNNHDHHHHHQIHQQHQQPQHLAQHQPQQQPMQQNVGSYLQLPGPDYIRRAHSDSSLPSSVAKTSNAGQMINNQSPIYQQQQIQPPQNFIQQQQQIMYNPQQNQQQLLFQQPLQHQHQQQHQFIYQQQQPVANLPPQQQQQPYQPQSTVDYNSIPYKNSLTLPTTAANNATTLNNNNTTTSASSPTNTTAPLNGLQHTIGIDPNAPNYLLPKFASKNEPNQMNQTKNVSPVYQQQSPQNPIQSPTTSPSQIPSPTQQPFNYHPQQLQQQQQQQYQLNYQQQQQQPQQQAVDIKPNVNLLYPNVQMTTGGSLPDLTSFQFQNPSNIHNQQQQFQNQNNMHPHQQQPQNYDFQLLQPTFPQHNHIGPVKPTHSGSVSPTRGGARYSPTHSNGVNMGGNRRPSPQRINSPLDLGLPNHLPLYTQQQQQQQAPNMVGNGGGVQSTPTSPSMQTLPSLEFTITSAQQQQQYMTMLNQNGVPTSAMYRTGSSSNGGINGGESLPPSPQSQQSCFNSPQGSPGPLSISPQDLNPFTSNNNSNNYEHDMMQKKFDSFNLDASNSTSFSPYTNAYNSNKIVLAQPPNMSNLPNGTHNNNNNSNNPNKNNVGLVNMGNNQQTQQPKPLDAINGGDQCVINANGNINTTSNGNNTSSTNATNNSTSIENNESPHQIQSSRSGSLSSNGSGSNLMNNNGMFEENTDFSINYQLPNSQQQQQHLTNANGNGNLKSHKNSIPNITISTYATSEEKNEISVNEDNYNEIMIKTEFDQIKTDVVYDVDLDLSDPIDDQNFNSMNPHGNYNGQNTILYQDT